MIATEKANRDAASNEVGKPDHIIRAVMQVRASKSAIETRNRFDIDVISVG